MILLQQSILIFNNISIFWHHRIPDRKPAPSHLLALLAGKNRVEFISKHRLKWSGLFNSVCRCCHSVRIWSIIVPASFWPFHFGFALYLSNDKQWCFKIIAMNIPKLNETKSFLTLAFLLYKTFDFKDF